MRGVKQLVRKTKETGVSNAISTAKGKPLKRRG
jgi:hypothetical protein